MAEISLILPKIPVTQRHKDIAAFRCNRIKQAGHIYNFHREACHRLI